jgi:plasmid stabilization system protein ParE
MAGRATDDPAARVIVAPRLRYLIFYAIAEDELQITHIRHTSRRRPSNWGR